MPYKVVKSGKGWKVKTTTTGKTHSKKSMSKGQAMAQMRALYSNVKG